MKIMNEMKLKFLLGVTNIEQRAIQDTNEVKCETKIGYNLW